MLEACRIGRVTRNGDINPLVVHDGNSFADVIDAVTAYLRAQSVGVRLFADDAKLSGRIVKFGLHIGKAIDARDNQRRILAQPVQDDPQWCLTHTICHFGDLDSSFRRSEGLVSCQEGEATSLFA